MNQTLGQRISVLRKKKNLTQEELADLLSVSGQAVSKWEQDRSCPDILQLPTLAKFLGVTIDELLTGEVSATATIPQKNEEYADRLLCISIVIRTYVKDLKLPLSLIEGAESLSCHFPEKCFEDLKSELENAIILAKKGVMGEVFSFVHVDDPDEPTVISMDVKTINEINEEYDED
ncbi:MAG: helix-turn-helix transcriptional regulator [Clostridia bacterium]|nr:helix-turn-helix transcriptional regulator [Clostridia bacterium]